MKVKVAQVTPSYFPHFDGVATHVQSLSEQLVKRGYELTVLTTDPIGELPKEESVNGVHILRFKSWTPSNSYFFSREMRTYLVKNSSSYDILHAHNYHTIIPMYVSQSKKENKFVFTPHYHGTGHTFFRSLLHVPWKFYAKKIFQKAECVISVSNYERNLLMKNFHLEPDRVVLVPNGLNLLEFESRERRSRSPSDKMAILCVTRLEKYKGVQYLIETLPQLRNQFVLEIVGNGPFKNSLERQVQKLRLSSRVSFFENLTREELLGRYRNADLFISLSKHEAYGLTVAEALASGLPCIVSNTSALTEWIDGQSCFGIDYPINAEVLSTLIDAASRRGNIVAALHGRIVDWENVSESVAKLYQNLMRQKTELPKEIDLTRYGKAE